MQLEGVVSLLFPQAFRIFLYLVFQNASSMQSLMLLLPHMDNIWCLLSPQTLCLQLHPATHNSVTSSHIPPTRELARTNHLSPAPPQLHWRRECFPRSCSSWQGSSPGSP